MSGISKAGASRFNNARKMEIRDTVRSRDADRQEWLRDFNNRIYGPFQDGKHNLPVEQGARRNWTAGVPYKVDPRSRPSPLPWGPGPDDGIIDHDANKVRTGFRTPDAIKKSIDLARRANEINKMLNLIDLLGQLSQFKNPHGIPDIEFEGYTRCDGPYPPIAPPNGMWFAPGALHCTDFQLTSQGFGSGSFTDFPEIQRDGEVTISVNRPQQFMMGWTKEGGARWDEHSSWIATDTPGEGVLKGTTSLPIEVTVLSGATGNPNLTRILSPSPQPLEQAIYDDAVVVRSPMYWPQAAAETMTGNAGGYANNVPIRHAFATMSSSGGGRLGPPVRVPVTPREPPGAFEKDKKVLSRLAQIGIAVYRVLDKTSEAADVVDAVFEALPKEVKKRYGDCKKSRGPVDNFGQYGISNADCKLKAIYHNWHLLDGEEAVKNIIKNQIEDWIYGNIHKRLPKQAGGPAMDQSWRLFGKGLKKLGL